MSTMEVIADEIEFLRTLVPLERARVVDLGCGNGDFARKLLSQGRAASVDAFAISVNASGCLANGSGSSTDTFVDRAYAARLAGDSSWISAPAFVSLVESSGRLVGPR